MMKSLSLTWLQRIIRVNEADEEYSSYNFDPENQLYAFWTLLERFWTSSYSKS